MGNLRFVTCLPQDSYYTWQVHLWLESLKELGHSNKAIVLIFIPHGKQYNKKWDQIISLYPETLFKFYFDDHGIHELLPIYIPVLRPYLMWRFYTDFPEMNDTKIFYCDSDVIFTNQFNISHLLEDDINYLSDTNSYINAVYFDSKEKDVLPEKLEKYKTIDVLDDLSKLIGINREIAETNNFNSGGAQYLLKNLDSSFWLKVMKDCITIRKYLQWINKLYFESEAKGFQSWCADMWAVLWNLWALNKQTKVVKDLDFAWASNPKTILDNYTILHNAGLSGDYYDNGNERFPVFFKGKYINGTDPLQDQHLITVINDNTSQKYCTHLYTEKLLELKRKYNLIY